MLPPVGWPGSSNPSGTTTCTRSMFRPSRAPAAPDQPPPCGRDEPYPPPIPSRDLRVTVLRPRSLMAAFPRSYTDGSRAAEPGSEECGSEEQLGPGEIVQFFLHGYANRL